MIKTNITDIVHQITKVLKEERLRQDIRISELSELSGVSKITIYHYEENINMIDLSVLIRVAYVLNLNMSTLFPATIIQKDPVAKQFDGITQSLSKKSINILLKIVKNMVDFYQS